MSNKIFCSYGLSIKMILCKRPVIFPAGKVIKPPGEMFAIVLLRISRYPKIIGYFFHTWTTLDFTSFFSCDCAFPAFYSLFSIDRSILSIITSSLIPVFSTNYLMPLPFHPLGLADLRSIPRWRVEKELILSYHSRNTKIRTRLMNKWSRCKIWMLWSIFHKRAKANCTKTVMKKKLVAKRWSLCGTRLCQGNVL